ncbi:hypothetical protein [Vibrio renipiscarius]|uniref:Uncharacterized protein n=1 Tax=Vibrio renipiscarius TaxID=1461322 RepID=A0A0C2NVF9_9VIBR|nr:hypothetical protein [Vibrio renipiscarius]KII76345.1 hypothetical protein OJ16_16225 [Vibrio renipiscarius]KII78132.1 hypothetical protein PL18_14345 [Vibrio renipiscarius]
MTTTDKHKARMNKIRQRKKTQHLKPLANENEKRQFLSGQVDNDFISENNVAQAYAARIEAFDVSVPREDALRLLDSISVGGANAVDTILEPVFLSLFDGTMRAFKIGTKQGITASRLYNECRMFDYDKPPSSSMLDSYTEHLNERDNIQNFAKQSEYKSGTMTRNGESIAIRDTGKNGKMTAARDAHFGSELTTKAADAYGGDQAIYQYKRQAKSEGLGSQHGEVDHVVPCAEICKNLKQNKALNIDDIKEIVNIDQNLALTSKENNAGKTFGKYAKNREELQQEIDQGYVEDSKGQHALSEEKKQIRKNMVERMDESQAKLDKATNKKALNNIATDRRVQKTLANDAKNAAANQSIGDVILFMIKPLYFELHDCFVNGIERGVNCSTFKSALTTRLGRMKKHVLLQAGDTLKGGVFNFFKNFLSMLLEGIVNCFVGIFKQVARMVKEGFKILLQIAPVLKDANKTPAEKGDAILKLIATSASIFASIGIEAWLNSLGLGEPWSIIVASILSAVVTALTLFLLDKMDLFGINKELKAQRVDEVLALKVEESKQEMFASIALLN